ELRMKYKFMEQNLLSKKNRLNTQIPDIQNNLEVLRFLKEKNVRLMLWLLFELCSFFSFYEKNTDLETSYLLDFHVYSRAKVTATENVGLWLCVSAVCLLQMWCNANNIYILYLGQCDA